MRTWPWDIALVLLGGGFFISLGVIIGMMVGVR